MRLKNYNMTDLAILSLKYLFFALCVVFSHYLLTAIEALYISTNLFYPIHIINFSVSFCSSLIILLLIKSLKNKIGFIFLALSIIKFFVVIAYLGYVIINNTKVEVFAIHFVCVYFLYLFFDVKWTVNKINVLNA